MLSDEQLAAMSKVDRQALAARLARFTDVRPAMTAAARRERRLFLNVIVVVCVFLIPWIVVLALTLPRRYVAGHWTALWVGLDVVELAALVVTGWAALRRRQIVIEAALVAGTLFVIDAWFDILTASNTGDLLASIATAVVGELPLAVFLFVVAHQLLRATTRETLVLVGQGDPPPPLWRVPLFAIDVVDTLPEAADPGADESGTPPAPGPA